VRHRVVEAIKHTVEDVDCRFVAAQERESDEHAFVSPQCWAADCAGGSVGADSTRFVLRQLTERGRLQLTGGRMTCPERF